jgi:ABC-type lipoprotein release transport system permease subunit
MRALLLGVGGADATTYAAVVTLVLVTALAASYLPARRAARLDPVQTLR